MSPEETRTGRGQPGCKSPGRGEILSVLGEEEQVDLEACEPDTGKGDECTK